MVTFQNFNQYFVKIEKHYFISNQITLRVFIRDSEKVPITRTDKKNSEAKTKQGDDLASSKACKSATRGSGRVFRNGENRYIKIIKMVI